MTYYAVMFLLILLFVFLSGYLSLGEASVSCVNAAKARAWGEKNSVWNNLVEWEIEHPQRVIITILVAHNLFSVTASSLMTLVTTHALGSGGKFWATAIMTVLMVLFADFLPKCIGLATRENTFLFVLPGLRASEIVLKPLILFLESLVLSASKLLHVDMTLQSSLVTRDEIEQLVESGEKSGAIEAEERRMIDGVIAFDETRVSEIMVPRTSMGAFEAPETIAGVLEQMQSQKSLHSRIPVYRDSPDNIIGVIYLKDMIPYLREGKVDTPLTAFMRQPLFIPETTRVNDLFETMKKQHVHFAVVVDEYGGTAGIVTLEDLLEEIVGDIRDEFDGAEAAPIVRVNDHTFRVKCTESLEDFAALADYEFDCDEVDSVGGYVLDRFRGFPAKGDVLNDGDWIIKVTSVGEHRVNEVLFIRNKQDHSTDRNQEE